MPTSKFDEYKKMQHDISKINPNRGSSPNQSKGFYAEVVNATENNLERIKKDIGARVLVVDDNGASDAIITYVNGQTGREIQDKVGYTYSQLKQMIDSGKYDGMIFSINKDHSVFSNSKQLDSLQELAKKRNIKIESSNVTEKEVLSLAKATSKEAQIRGIIGLDDTEAPVVAAGYTAKKVIDDTINNSKAFVSEQTGRFMSENFKKINAAGVDEAFNSALFAATLSVTKNVISLAKSEEDINEALKQVLVDTSTAAVLGYATGVAMEKMALNRGSAAALVNTTVQVSKQMLAYVNGNIDEEQLMTGIAESVAYSAVAFVGKCLGEALIPVPYVGAYIGEMITTAICSEVISTIKDTREFEKQNQKYISLYRRAEAEIKLSNERLTAVIETENEEFKKVIKEGFEEIYKGININSYDTVIRGLLTIGSQFDMTESDFRKDIITKENLFENTETVLVIGEEG